MLYMVTFTINIPPMLAYIPYMDPMGNIKRPHSNHSMVPMMWIPSLPKSRSPGWCHSYAATHCYIKTILGHAVGGLNEYLLYSIYNIIYMVTISISWDLTPYNYGSMSTYSWNCTQSTGQPGTELKGDINQFRELKRHHKQWFVNDTISI
jgi:hypothetical protein